jgi:hypothetical protein
MAGSWMLESMEGCCNVARHVNITGSIGVLVPLQSETQVFCSSPINCHGVEIANFCKEMVSMLLSNMTPKSSTTKDKRTG